MTNAGLKDLKDLRGYMMTKIIDFSND